jgi:RNAse (barnase) inhibitor barstar
MDVEHLSQPTARWLWILAEEENRAYDRAATWERATKGRLCVRQVRGAKALSVPALFDEFAAALQFPPYFGENWDALEECLADLRWLPVEARLLLLRDSVRLLEGATAGEQIRLWSLLTRVANGWNCPAQGTAQAFHIIVQCRSQERRLLYEKLTEWRVESFLGNPC